MGISDRVAARYLGYPVPTSHRRAKTAAFPPFPPKDDNQGVGMNREIPKDHPFDKRALKPLSKALWASTVALGHALTAYRHLSRIKSATVSPDGRLGGKGYVMQLGVMRQKLFEASEALSSISDTIYDEITAPHWKPRLAQLDEDDREDVSRFVDEAQEGMENPEGLAEEEIEKIEGDEDSKPKSKEKSEPGQEEESSSLPTEGGVQAEPEAPSHMKQASSNPLYDMLYSKEGNSSIPVHELGGPRVDHIGPGNGDGLYGDYNDETLPHDQWSADGGGVSRRDDGGEDYDYTSEWENEMPVSAESMYPDGGNSYEHLLEIVKAESLYPDSSSDGTPTDAWDFGLGYGAKGQGAGNYQNPSGEGRGDHGVVGPHSGLPGAPSQSSGDTTQVVLDDKLNPRQAAYVALYGKLPQDVAGPPARSDYYPGEKDNMVSVGTSEVPGEERVEGIGGQPLVDTYFREEDLSTDYQRYDNTTRTLRDPDKVHPGQNYGEPFAPDGVSTR